MSIRLGWRAATAALAFTAAIAVAGGATAEPKKAEDVHIIFVTHGQANDVYWSVVKNGVQAGQKAMGVKVDYHAPETFDMVQMAQLIDAAIAEKPDAIVVSIPDADALKKPVMDAKAAGIPVGVIDTGSDQVPRLGPRPLGRRRLRIRQRRPCRRDHGQGRRQAHGLRQPRGRQCQPRRPLPRLQGRARQERRRDLRRAAGVDGSDRHRRPRRGLSQRPPGHRRDPRARPGGGGADHAAARARWASSARSRWAPSTSRRRCSRRSTRAT